MALNLIIYYHPITTWYCTAVQSITIISTNPSGNRLVFNCLPPSSAPKPICSLKLVRHYTHRVALLCHGSLLRLKQEMISTVAKKVHRKLDKVANNVGYVANNVLGKVKDRASIDGAVNEPPEVLTEDNSTCGCSTGLFADQNPGAGPALATGSRSDAIENASPENSVSGPPWWLRGDPKTHSSYTLLITLHEARNLAPSDCETHSSNA